LIGVGAFVGLSRELGILAAAMTATFVLIFALFLFMASSQERAERWLARLLRFLPALTPLVTQMGFVNFLDKKTHPAYFGQRISFRLRLNDPRGLVPLGVDSFVGELRHVCVPLNDSVHFRTGA